MLRSARPGALSVAEEVLARLGEVADSAEEFLAGLEAEAQAATQAKRRDPGNAHLEALRRARWRAYYLAKAALVMAAVTSGPAWPSQAERELAEEAMCDSVRSDGQACRARRWAGTAFCWAHQPGRFERRAAIAEEGVDPLGAAVGAWLLAWEAAHA
jgi:hypothetical protein